MTAALLPTPIKINPANPDPSNYLVEPNMTAYVMAKRVDGGFAKPGRVFTSHGTGMEADWAIDTIHGVHHDQTGRFRENFKVVGIARWTPAGVLTEGLVPDKALGHSVFK